MESRGAMVYAALAFVCMCCGASAAAGYDPLRAMVATNVTAVHLTVRSRDVLIELLLLVVAQDLISRVDLQARASFSNEAAPNHGTLARSHFCLVQLELPPANGTEGVGNFAAESYRDWLPGGANNRPTAIEVSSASNAWREKLAGAGRVWLVRYPANKRDETAQAVEAELQSRYTAGTTKQFRAITVTEFVPKP